MNILYLFILVNCTYQANCLNLFYKYILTIEFQKYDHFTVNGFSELIKPYFICSHGMKCILYAAYSMMDTSVADVL